MRLSDQNLLSKNLGALPTLELALRRPSSCRCALTLILPYYFTSLFPHFVSSHLFRPLWWTDGQLQAIIPFRRHDSGWRLSRRRENEHFSKCTKPAGVVPLRIHRYAAVGRRAVHRRDRPARRAGLFRLYHAIPAEPGPRGAAETEQGSYGAARSGQFTHRGFEEQDGDYDAESRLDAVGNRAGQEPRRSDSQRTADIGPETHRPTKGKRRKDRGGGQRSGRRQERHRSHENRFGSHQGETRAQPG